jgi:Flp pilus assembly protein TadD
MRTIAPIVMAACALSACATAPGEKAAKATVAEAPKIDYAQRLAMDREDSVTQMAFWAQESVRFPDDLAATLKFVDVLEKNNRHERAVEVAVLALERFKGEPQLLQRVGMGLIALGRGAEALRPMAVLVVMQPQDWRLRSALGVALDQSGRFADARASYKKALELSPQEPGVLTNLGVSYLLSGEPKEAEKILRQAVASISAPAEARQNLALAVGLQGRFDEAERIARADLPAAAAANNVAVLRSLLSDTRRWGDLKGD